MDPQLRERIEGIVGGHPVVLFMKGTKSFPQCGFSATVVEILRRLDVDFHAVNVLAEPDLRQGMKEFSNWPTFPQLYVRGQFVGGCDIVRDMFAAGELEALLQRDGNDGASAR